MVGSRCRDFKNREVSNVNAPHDFRESRKLSSIGKYLKAIISLCESTCSVITPRLKFIIIHLYKIIAFIIANKIFLVWKPSKCSLVICNSRAVSDHKDLKCLQHRLLSHESKVSNLNLNSKCAFWIKIWKTVVWTVCTPNYIAMHHLKCAFQMTVWRCFQVTHLANHAAKSLYECPDL